MNKKITVRNDQGTVCYCILSGNENLEDQFNEWYFGSKLPNGGICVRFDEKTLSVVDYFYNERMAEFDVVSIEDTDEDLMPKWFNVNTGDFGWT